MRIVAHSRKHGPAFVSYPLYISISLILLAILAYKIDIRASTNLNEGWAAYWADAAWNGSGLYPPPASLKLNNYPPLWPYVTGALGQLTGDNIQAGRILAGLALLANAFLVSRIVVEITGRARLFPGLAFLAMFALFYAHYAGADDPQMASNTLMLWATLLFIRACESDLGGKAYSIVALMLLAGLTKHSTIAAPISMAVFLLLNRRSAFRGFALCCAGGIALACVALYVLFWPGFFSSLLFPRAYSVADAVHQTGDQLLMFNLFILAVPFLMVQPGLKTRFVSIYALVSFAQGALFSGGEGVDVNVFFDFAIAVCIALGVMEGRVAETLQRSRAWSRAGILAAWAVLAWTPPVLALKSGWHDIQDLIDPASTQEPDISYVRSRDGKVICQNLALCYWAGKSFEVDLVTMSTLARARPDVESELVARMDKCVYSLVQLEDDWDDSDDTPFTPAIRAALTAHYGEVRSTENAGYWGRADCTPAP